VQSLSSRLNTKRLRAVDGGETKGKNAPQNYFVIDLWRYNLSKNLIRFFLTKKHDIFPQ